MIFAETRPTPATTRRSPPRRALAPIAAALVAACLTTPALAQQTGSTTDAATAQQAAAASPASTARQAADASSPIWSYGARGALTVLSQESLDPGVGFTVFAVRPLTTDLEFEGEAGYQFMNTIPNGLPAGRLALIPLRASLRVQLWRYGGAKPYATGGAGAYLARFALDDAARAALNQLGFGVSTSVETALGLHVGGGAEWQRDRWHVGIDVKYVFGEADAQSTVIDQVTQEIFRETSPIDLNGFWIAAGARIEF